MSARPGGLVRLLALVAAEAAAWWLLWRLGHWTGPVNLHDPQAWLASTPLDTAIAALVRLAAIAGASWLTGSTVLAIAAELPGFGALRPFARKLSIPLVRRLVESAFAIGIGVSAISGPAFAAGSPAPRAAVAIAVTAEPSATAPGGVRVQVRAEAMVGSSAPATAPDPPGVAQDCQVLPGDSLWRIAQRRLGSGRRYLEIWQANKGHVMAGGRSFTNPDVIHPGWVLALPADAEGTPTIAPTPAPTPSVLRAPTSAADPREAPDTPEVPPQAEQPAATTGLTAETPAHVDATESAPPPTLQRPEPTTQAPAQAEELHPLRQPQTITTRPHGSRPTMPIAVGIGLFASLAVAGTTALRRKAVRPRPASAPPAPFQARPAERHLRAIADDEAPAWIDATLRLLTVSSRTPPPPIRLLRAGALGVEVLLAEPSLEAPGGFIAEDDGWMWRVDPGRTLEAARQLAKGAPAACPATAPIGATPDGVVLLDLEHAGRLAITGPVEPALRSISEIAMTLATAPWARGCELLSFDLELPGALGVTRLSELAAAREAIGMARFQAGAAMADGAPTVLAARCADPTRDDAPPVILLVGRALTPDELGVLDELAPAGTPGVAVVGLGLLPGTSWVLTIADDGSADLDPVDLHLQLTPSETAERVTEALAPLAEHVVTIVDAEPDQTVETDTEPEPPSAFTVVRDDQPEALPSTPAAELDVLVLGPLVLSGTDVSPRKSRVDSQILVRLAVEDGPLSLEALRQDLYPEGTATENTFDSAVKRARKRFGLDRNGKGFIGAIENGAINTCESVGCDLHSFRRLAASGPAGDIEALRLIRGEPFSDLPAGYDWVDAGLVYSIQTEIIPIADRASAAALAAGDIDLARWAAKQGLLAAPDHEGLRLQRARAEAADGDLHALRRTMAEIDEIAADLDAEPLAETVEAMEHLIAAVAHRERKRAS